MALIGLYVGVIPIAIGMLWLPWLRSVDARWIRFLLAFTVGLLGFLAIEALLEGTELANDGAAGARRRRAGLARGGGRLPGAGGRGRVAARRAKPARERRRRSAGRARGLPRRARDRAPQPRRGARHRLGLRDRVAGAGRRRSSSASPCTTPPRGSRSSRRWRAPGTARPRTLVLLGVIAGAPAGAGRLDRGLERSTRSVAAVHVRHRRRGDRPGDRPDPRPGIRAGDGHGCSTRTPRAGCSPGCS